MIITFSVIFSGVLNVTVYFNTSTHEAIIWLSLAKHLTVLSNSQTELRPEVRQTLQNEMYRRIEDDRH